ncbi:MAG TPA: hypothetical protein VIT91_08470 [Chthoniobacterales bacterium]
MGLTEIQTALARLYTDTEARSEFFADRSAFAVRFGLSQEETEALADSAGVEIERFAGSLLRKRFNEATRSVPLARRVLGQKLFGVFERYTAETGAAATRNPALDGLSFNRWLLTNSLVPLTAANKDLLRYEVAWLTMQHSSRRFLIRLLHLPGCSPFHRSLLIWFRWRNHLHHWHGP